MCSLYKEYLQKASQNYWVMAMQTTKVPEVYSNHQTPNFAVIFMNTPGCYHVQF